jgi:3-oxoacyl-[acyl-carrier protein] reductase
MSALTGQHVLVTGASRGIGAAAAVALAKEGAVLTLVSRDRRRTEEIAGAVAEAGGIADVQLADVANYAVVERAFGDARRRRGPVVALINNAGVIEPICHITESDPSAWARNIEINLIGAYNVIRAILPGMLATGGGRIINLSSGAATNPLEGWGAYCAAKAGLAMLTRMLALEAGDRVRVFGLSPGTTDTDMQAVIRASGINRISQIPREALTPVEHPARAIVYLCTPEANDLAGTEVALNDPAFRRRLRLPV